MAKDKLMGGIRISDDDFTDEELSIIYGTTRAGTGVPGQKIKTGVKKPKNSTKNAKHDNKR